MPTDQGGVFVGLELAGCRLLGFLKRAARLVQLLAVSGMRLGEATRIVWREVDLKKGQFTVSERDIGTKNGKMRIVSLFPRLRSFLEKIRPEGEEFETERIVGVGSTISAVDSGCKTR